MENHVEHENAYANKMFTMLQNVHVTCVSSGYTVHKQVYIKINTNAQLSACEGITEIGPG